jgi:hypothetical protein
VAENTHVKHSLQPALADGFPAPRSPRPGVTFGSDAIIPIPPNGFALATRLHFVLSGHVAFPEQSGRVPARGTEIPAQSGEDLAFVQPGYPTNFVKL